MSGQPKCQFYDPPWSALARPALVKGRFSCKSALPKRCQATAFRGVLHRHSKCRTRVATATAVKAKVASKSSLAVMTCRTVLSASIREVLECRRRIDLFRLRKPGGDFVAILTGQSLLRSMPRMTERKPKDTRVCVCRVVAARAVTDSTRC